MKTRLLFGIFLILMITISCNRKKEVSNDITISYNDYIYNAALSYPHECNHDRIYYGFYSDDSVYFKDIVRIQKSLYNDDIKLLMNLHSWRAECHCYPNVLIYVTDKKKFNYIIPFFDEQYYLMQSSFIYWKNDTLFYKQLTSETHLVFYKNYRLFEETEQIQYKNYDIIKYTENGMAFQIHLNEILNHIYPKSYVKDEVKSRPERSIFKPTIESDSSNKIRKEKAFFLIKQVAALLELKEITIKDTQELYKNRNYMSRGPDSECGKNYKQNLDTMFMRLKTHNYLYFTTYKGQDAFWEFELKNDEYNRCKIYARIINSECFHRVVF